MFTDVEFGRRAYVLCATLTPSLSLMKKFGADSAIVIHDTEGFATAVAGQVSGFTKGVDGACSYQANQVVMQDGGYQSWVNQAPMDGARFEQFMRDLMGCHPYFLKHKDYQEQNEWRFVWETSMLPSDQLDIVVPEARQYCSR